MNAIRLTTLEVPEPAEMGISIEGSTAAWPQSTEPAELPACDSFNQQRRFVDVFNKGKTPFGFTATADAPWILVSATKGEVTNEQRVWISIDWSKIATNQSTGSVKFTGAGRDIGVNVTAFRPTEVTRENLSGFVEADGVVSIEAEHFTAINNSGENKWVKIPNFGNTLSAMRAVGPTDVVATPGKDSPCLEYKMFLFTNGPVKVETTLGPTLNFLPDRGLRYAVSFDDETPSVVTAVPADFNVRNGNRDWEESVKNNFRRVSSTHTISSPGYHTLKIWMVDPAVMLERLVVNTGGSKPSYLGPTESFHH
jgi:hypothetical protein